MALSWYTFGGGQELTDLLMNITMLARSGAFINLIDLIMITGLFFAFIFAAFSGRVFSTPIRNFVIMMIVVYGLLKPTSDVMIVDQRTGQNYNVSNVPLGIALFGHFQSSLSNGLVNFFEKTLNNGNYYASYAKYGFGFGPFSTKAIVEYMSSPAIGSGNPEYGRLMANLSQFSRECFGYSAAQSNNNMALMAIKAMPTSNDAFKIFLGQDQNYPYINGGLTMDYLNSNGSYQSLNCKDAGSKIYNDVNSFVNSSELDRKFVDRVKGMLSVDPTSLASDLQSAMEFHYNSLSQLDKLKMNILFSSMSYDFIKLGASGLSNSADVSNYAVNSVLGSAKASAIQQAIENFGQGAIAVALAPKMLNFTKMMYYLLFFILLTLALTPLARAIGKVTLVFFVFLTILEPLYVLLNYLLNTMAYYQVASSTTCNNSPAGILSCLDINSLFYTNVLNFSILGLIGLAYMLASAMVTGSGAVIGAIGDKFGTGAITYQGANNNIGSLSNFVNDPVKMLAAQNTSTSSFISDGGAGFQSSLASYMATSAAMNATGLGAQLATYNSAGGTITKDGYTAIDGVKYSNVMVNNRGQVSGFKTAEGTLGQLVRGFMNSGDASLAKLAGTLQFLANHMGKNGAGVSATVTKGANGYTVEFDMGQAGTSGKQSIILDRNGNFVQGSIDTGKGKIMIENGHVKIGGQDLTSDLQRLQRSYEEKKLAEVGETFAKSLGYSISKQDLIKLGQLISNSKSTTHLSRSLAETARQKALELVDRFQNKSSDATTELYQHEMGRGVGIGGQVGTLGSISWTDREQEIIRQGNISEIAKLLESKKAEAKTDSELKAIEDTLSYVKMAQTVSERATTNSDTLTKEFLKAKQLSERMAFSETESAAFAQEIARKYGVELTPEALQELVGAVKSGDNEKIMSVLGGISTKPEWRVGEDAEKFAQQQEKTKQSIGNLQGKVEGKTSNVEENANKNEKELEKDEKNVGGKLEQANNLKDVHVPKVPEPTPPTDKELKAPWEQTVKQYPSEQVKKDLALIEQWIENPNQPKVPDPPRSTIGGKPQDNIVKQYPSESVEGQVRKMMGLPGGDQSYNNTGGNQSYNNTDVSNDKNSMRTYRN